MQQQKRQPILDVFIPLSVSQKDNITQLMWNWELTYEEIVKCFQLYNNGYTAKIKYPNDYKATLTIYFKNNIIDSWCEGRNREQLLAQYFKISEDMVSCFLDIVNAKGYLLEEII